MTLKDHFNADLSLFFNTDEFAVEVIYGCATVKVIVDYLKDPNIFGEKNVSDKAQVYIRKEDAGNPKFGDFMFFDEKSWKVVGISSGEDGSVFVLDVERDERVRV